MPGAATLVLPRRIPAPTTRTRKKTAPEERWWFPLGSITRAGEGVFRWHRINTELFTGELHIESGRLDVYDDVGHVLDEDITDDVIDEDPNLEWYDKCPPFPYSHFFHDEVGGEVVGADGKFEDQSWLCIHANYGSSKEIVERLCAED